MAKRKVVDSGKAVKSGSSQDSKKPVAKRSKKSVSVTRNAQPSLTGIEIGRVAGEVWQLLTDEEEHSLASIKKTIAAPELLVLAAIGWLAREDKLQFKTSGRTTKVSLR